MTHIKRLSIFVASFFLVVSAAVVNVNNLYYMAALLVSLPWVSYLVGMFSLRDLQFSREAPGTGWVGEKVDFLIRVRSSGRLPRFGLEVREDLPKHLEPAEEPVVVLNAAARAESQAAFPVHLRKRGLYRIDSMLVTAPDPMGLFAFTKRFPVPSEIVVYPVPEHIEDVMASGADRFGYRDLPVASVRGTGVDPDGVREYVPGDPLRRVHWKSFAKTGKLSVIEFEESRSIDVVVALDLEEGTNTGVELETTLEYAVRCAASLAQVGIRHGASVRLLAGAEPCAASIAGRGTEQLFNILDRLARVEATDRKPLSDSLVERAGHIPPGTSLVVITSSLNESLPGALLHYSLAGVRVCAILLDPAEFAGRRTSETDRKFRDNSDRFCAAGAHVYMLPLAEGQPLQLKELFAERSYAYAG